jgi:hypothetical protein
MFTILSTAENQRRWNHRNADILFEGGDLVWEARGLSLYALPSIISSEAQLPYSRCWRMIGEQNFSLAPRTLHCRAAE